MSSRIRGRWGGKCCKNMFWPSLSFLHALISAGTGTCLAQHQLLAGKMSTLLAYPAVESSSSRTQFIVVMSLCSYNFPQTAQSVLCSTHNALHEAKALQRSMPWFIAFFSLSRSSLFSWLKCFKLPACTHDSKELQSVHFISGHKSKKKHALIKISSFFSMGRTHSTLALFAQYSTRCATLGMTHCSVDKSNNCNLQTSSFIFLPHSCGFSAWMNCGTHVRWEVKWPASRWTLSATTDSLNLW